MPYIVVTTAGYKPRKLTWSMIAVLKVWSSALTVQVCALLLLCCQLGYAVAMLRLRSKPQPLIPVPYSTL